MLGRRPPLLAGLSMILCVLSRLAPRTGDPEVVPVVGSAVFERNDVLDDPIIGRTQLASALPAAAVPFQKQLRGLLLREANAGVMVPGGAGHVDFAFCISRRMLPLRQSMFAGTKMLLRD